jgi:uroporphyrin-III C-methyltransferase/precorrin-2 dehydrogenase/sirohydrochlorin ferrochelatase
MFPIMLDLRDRPSLVVGAGPIAQRKLQQLLAEGARVTVVAPHVIEPIAKLAAAGDITLHVREFVDTDVEGHVVVMVATNQRAVNEQVTRAARAHGIWVNVADVPDLCDFHLPASMRRGDLQLTIASGGGAPFAVRRLRELFERKIGPAWADWLSAAKRFRRRVQALGLAATEADVHYDRFFADTVDPTTLAVRPPTERDLDDYLAPPTGPNTATGHVSLVGAGPGNPGLLTVEGLRRLHRAHAVVYDRLAIPALPLDLPDTVELISVGKEPGHHAVPQDEINALLVKLAREGKRVVRLKGGDPFVFARGGEEVRVLRQEGIACEVISGVTAGIAVPAAANIPVTYRGEAVRLTFVTGHEGGAPRARWDLLAKDTHATLVGYMGVSTLADVVDGLMAAGMDAQTPGAVIEQGTLARQRSVRAPIVDLVAAAEKAGLRPPAIFVIGRVVAHAEVLATPVPAPLAGKRIAVFAPCSEIVERLRAAGAEALCAPAPLTKAARLVLASAPLTGFVLRSSHELDAVETMRASGATPGNVTLWCTDEALAADARGRGHADVVTVEVEHLVAGLHDRTG